MSVEAMINRLAMLGKERGNFFTGEVWTPRTLQHVEALTRRKLPKAWQGFLVTYGAGHFQVKGPGYSDWQAPESAIGAPYRVKDEDGANRMESFDVEFVSPAYYEREDSSWQHGLTEFEGGWLEVGGDVCGDSLIVRTGGLDTEAKEDGEIAWREHETGERPYRWPSFVAFWEHMLAMDEATPAEEKIRKDKR